nr:hypothetical protein [Pimelobacter simplex]
MLHSGQCAASSPARGSGRVARAAERTRSSTNVSAASQVTSSSPSGAKAASSWSYFAIVPGPSAVRWSVTSSSHGCRASSTWLASATRRTRVRHPARPYDGSAIRACAVSAMSTSRSSRLLTCV